MGTKKGREGDNLQKIQKIFRKKGINFLLNKFDSSMRCYVNTQGKMKEIKTIT